ncbi:MAG TPA: peptidylprolyl isomerase [Candidatus Acidoferrales bacterium]|nr:peptidylprolyl isomerase [Candidatus Acidoferrales bacterium]
MAALMFLGAVPTQTAVEIVHLESERSLGDGRLAALLASSDEATAARAALAIGRTKLAAGIPLLETHLDDPRDAVRAFSIYGLGLIGEGNDAAAMLKALRADHAGAVQIAALDALGRYEEAKRLDAQDEAATVQVLATILDAPERFTPDVRGRAAIALGFFSGDLTGVAAASKLATILESERDPSVRERIMWTIFRYYAAKVPIATLRAGLKDSDEIVRIEAVRAYGRLKEAALVADLQPLLSDPSWRVQEQTAESIRLLQGGKLTEHWTAIPSFVHTPAPQRDPYAALPVVPRTSPAPGAPRAEDILEAQPLLPQTAREMLSPAHGLHPRLRIVTTQGNIYVVLYPEWAPLTVANFLNMMNRGFLDNNPWFRIVPDFVVQTGEQDAKNAPGPGYSIPAEENPLEQNAYVISMGLNYDDKLNTPIRDSAGSEYYITLSPQYHLDNAFTVFGAMTSGFDVLGRLTEADKVLRVERIRDDQL